jgi:hypothetical protein
MAWSTNTNLLIGVVRMIALVTGELDEGIDNKKGYSKVALNVYKRLY